VGAYRHSPSLNVLVGSLRIPWRSVATWGWANQQAGFSTPTTIAPGERGAGFEPPLTADLNDRRSDRTKGLRDCRLEEEELAPDWRPWSA